ncbi:MAG TPA: hypothetical protein PK360_09995 [bacterium]|nr:hypothetical protein [bacterium]
MNEDGVSGLVVPPRDPRALSEAIRRILQEDLRAKLSEGARQRARDRFNFEEAADRLEAVYHACLNQKPPA